MSIPSIYFHHIPKTAGSLTFTNLNHGGLKYQLQEKGLIYHQDRNHIINLLDEDEISKASFINGHYAANPYYINPKVVGITIIRDPAARIISHFWWFLEYEKYFNKYDKKDMEDRLKFFDIWINNNEDMHIKSNFQAKFLVNKLDDEVIKNNYPIYRGEMEELSPRIDHAKVYKIGWGVDNKDVTLEEAHCMLNKMAIVAKTETINKDMNTIIDFINKYLNLNVINPNIEKYNVNEATKDFYASLPKQNLEKILELNQIDYSLWESPRSNFF
jgi:hypothetical protein